MFLKCYEKNNNDCQIYKKTNQFCKIYLRVDVIPGSLLLFFFKAFFFHFTSNSLFDFCCVILRFPLICFLLQLRCSSFHSPSLSFSLLKKTTIYISIAKSFIWPHIFYLFRNREKILVDLWFHIDIRLQL